MHFCYFQNPFSICYLFLTEYNDIHFQISLFEKNFFCLTPPPYSQFRDPGVRPAPQGAIRGKEVVFFEAEWPGFEPWTSSIRRGRSIHSATPHLAMAALILVVIAIRYFLKFFPN